MPRYFFDVTDESGVHTDDVGIELPSMEAAIIEARRALADMTRDSLMSQSPTGITIRIRHGQDGPVDLQVRVTTDWFNGE